MLHPSRVTPRRQLPEPSINPRRCMRTRSQNSCSLCNSPWAHDITQGGKTNDRRGVEYATYPWHLGIRTCSAAPNTTKPRAKSSVVKTNVPNLRSAHFGTNPQKSLHFHAPPTTLVPLRLKLFMVDNMVQWRHITHPTRLHVKQSFYVTYHLKTMQSNTHVRMSLEQDLSHRDWSNYTKAHGQTQCLLDYP